jgi:hypothetical protein
MVLMVREHLRATAVALGLVQAPLPGRRRGWRGGGGPSYTIRGATQYQPQFLVVTLTLTRPPP